MTPEQEIHLANRAKEVVENEAYQNAYKQIHDWIDQKWRDTPVRDADGREHLWMLQHLLTKLQMALEATMDGGKLSQKELEHQRSLASRAKLWLA